MGWVVGALAIGWGGFLLVHGGRGVAARQIETRTGLVTGSRAVGYGLLCVVGGVLSLVAAYASFMDALSRGGD